MAFSNGGMEQLLGVTMQCARVCMGGLHLLGISFTLTSCFEGAHLNHRRRLGFSEKNSCGGPLEEGSPENRNQPV